MSRRAVVIDQPSLWDDESPPAPPKPQKAAPPPRVRNHTLDLPKPATTHCMAICLTCRRPEEIGTCETGCSIVCARPTEPAPVEICLTRTQAHAELITSPNTHDQHLLVRHCPHCTQTHRHATTSQPHRQCPRTRKPYILKIQEFAP